MSIIQFYPLMPKIISHLSQWPLLQHLPQNAKCLCAQWLWQQALSIYSIYHTYTRILSITATIFNNIFFCSVLLNVAHTHHTFFSRIAISTLQIMWICVENVPSNTNCLHFCKLSTFIWNKFYILNNGMNPWLTFQHKFRTNIAIISKRKTNQQKCIIFMLPYLKGKKEKKIPKK